MNIRILLLFSFLVGTVIVILTGQEAMTSSLGPPPASTGSPGDNFRTCARSGCHSATVNSGPGMLSIDLTDIPSTGYIPGESYDIVVNLSESGISRFGFMLTAENSSAVKAGTFTANALVQVSANFWATHRSAGSNNSWTVAWTAPTSGDSEITFYAAGNAANNNRSSSGDHIYTTNKQALKDIHAAIETQVVKPAMILLGNVNRRELVIECGREEQFDLYSVNGERVHSFQVFGGRHVEDISAPGGGLYVLRGRTSGFVEKILIP